MRRLTWATVLLILAVAGWLGGCGARPHQIVYVIVPKSLKVPVFVLARRGAEREARKIGSHIRIEYQASPTSDAAQQADIVNTLASRHVDGISISVIDANLVGPAINNAVAQGVAVMTFDSDAPDTKRATFFGVDDEEIGAEVAHQIQLASGEREMAGEYAILSGQPSAPNLRARTRGVEKYFQKLPEMQQISGSPLFCQDDAARAVNQIESVMASHPRLRAWAFVGGWPLFVEGALNSIADPDRTLTVSVDALPAEWQYLRSGRAKCLVAQRYFDWGSRSVQILEDLRLKRKTYPKRVFSGYDIVYANPSAEQRKQAREAVEGKEDIAVYSLEEYAAKWKAWNQIDDDAARLAAESEPVK